MAMTKRARKRILLLCVSILAVGGLVLGTRLIQDRLRANRAEVARELGAAAMRKGDWETALTEWSLVVARDKRDITSILMLAEARLQLPTPNNKHLERALSLFLLADELAEETNAPATQKIAALEGRGRIEVALKQVARLRESSLRLLELDPGNSIALEQLFAVSDVMGIPLPSDPELFIRGDRSTADWLQAMRDVGDESSLRWLLERFIDDPTSSDILFKIMSLLQRAGSDNRQEARLGAIQESRVELLRRMAVEYPAISADLEVLVAREWLVDNQIQQAQATLSAIDFERVVNPEVLLLASAIQNAFGTPESRIEGNRILNLAATGVGKDIASRIRVATQLWHLDQAEKSIRLVEDGLESGSLDAPRRLELLILASQLKVLNQVALSEDRRLSLESGLTQRDLSPLNRSRIQVLLKATELQRLIGSDSSEGLRPSSIDPEFVKRVAVLCGNFSSWANDPLTLCILADLAAMAELDTTASGGFVDALAATGGISAPISRRLVASYARHGASLQAFEVAANYLRQYQTRYAAAIFAEAWLNLRATGLRGIDYQPWIADLGTPAEFLLRARSEEAAEADFISPVLARALDAEGDASAAREVLLDAIAATDEPRMKARLLSTMSGLAYEIPDSILDAMATEAIGEEERLAIIRLKASQIELLDGPAAALAWLESEAQLEAKSKLQRFKGMLEFRALRASGASESPAFETLLSGEVLDRDLPLFMRLAVEANDRSSAERIFGLVAGRDTERVLTPRRALVMALFVVNFEINNRESVDTAVRVLDPLVSSGRASPELEFLYAQLLRNSGDDKTMIAIEMLRSSVSRYPERYANGLLLCEMLQDTIQFEEAGEILSSLSRRTDIATSQQQMKLSLLLSRQGEFSKMAESICDLAAKTGNVSSVLQCIQAKRVLGELDEVNRLLDELSVREDRTAAVEIQLARRIQLQGDVDSSFEYLEQSGKFSSDAEKTIAIAELANAVGRWDEVISRLQDSDDEVQQSAKAQLLLATALLEVVPPATLRAVEALRRAVELEPADRGVLRRAAVIAISTEELQELRSYFLDRLEAVDTSQADLLRLGVDLDEAVSIAGSNWRSLEARSAQIVASLPRLPIAWDLRLDVLSAAVQSARRSGDPDAVERFSGLLADTAREYVSRFPGQSSALSRQARVMLQLGKPEEALLVARAGIDASVESPRIGIFMDLAQAEFRMGNHQRVIDTLAGFSSQILAGASQFPRAWNLMFQSLLFTGKIEDAVQLYKVGPVSENGQTDWARWISTVESLDPRIGLEAARVVVSNTSDVQELLALSMGLHRLYQSSGDARIFAYAKELDDRIGILVAAMPDSDALNLYRMQMAALTVEVSALSDYSKAALEGMAVFELMSREGLRTRAQIDALPAEERMLAEAEFAATVVFLNNLVARAAEVIRDDMLGESEASRLATVGEAASAYLLAVLPQNSDILDSVADFKLAVGEVDLSVELIRNAIRINPSNPLYYSTLAKGLLEQGQLGAAADQAGKALRLARGSAIQDSKLLSKIGLLIEKIEAESRALP